MEEIIRSGNASYILYEELLLKKENLRREANQYYDEYLREFGELLTEAFLKKIECIRKKKIIAYCQKCVNLGKKIHASEMEAAVRREMEEYEQSLKQLKESVRNARDARLVSREDARRIKEIYYRLARMIHPDMRPDLAEDTVLQGYWNRIVIAYRCNHLQELEELETLVNSRLEKQGISCGMHIIPGIEEKIRQLEKEIERILSTSPYTYRFDLTDDRKRTKRREELQKEIREYEQYSGELSEILNSFPIQEMYA